MIEETKLSKVDILIQQAKYSQAEEILKSLLLEDPNNAQYLSLLAEMYLQQDSYELADEITDSALALSPDSPYLFYLKSRISIHKKDYDNAEYFIKQALKLDPYDADYIAFYADIRLSRKDFDEALELANKALEVDAENILALNVRSSTLIKLNKSEESFDTIENALREDPNNAYTHANYGWNLLEKGDYKKALEHFKEALKTDPNFEYAQAGMLEAIKATNPIYRLFMKYSFWMGNLTAKYQWGVIIGFYVAFRVLRSVAQKNEVLQPYLTPLVVLIAIIAFSTWIITPVSNLILRFNKYGKLLLDKNEKMSSNFVGISLIVFVIGVVSYFAFDQDKFLPVAAYGFAMMVPLSVMFTPSKRKNAFLIYTIAMAVVGFSSIAITFSNGEIMNNLSLLFMVGFIGFQWIANFLIIKDDNV